MDGWMARISENFLSHLLILFMVHAAQNQFSQCSHQNKLGLWERPKGNEKYHNKIKVAIYGNLIPNLKIFQPKTFPSFSFTSWFAFVRNPGSRKTA